MPQSGYMIRRDRTDGISPSEISQAIWDGSLPLCPYEALTRDQADTVMTGFLYRGTEPYKKDPPRTMTVLSVGLAAGGIPAARIQIAEPDRVLYENPAICTYCPAYEYDCAQVGKLKLSLYDVRADDPMWNADEMDNGDD